MHIRTFSIPHDLSKAKLVVFCWPVCFFLSIQEGESKVPLVTGVIV